MFHGHVTERYVRLRRAAFLMCGDWDRAGELARDTLARGLTEPDVADPDLWAYGDLMAAYRKPRGRREHVFVAPQRDGEEPDLDPVAVAATADDDQHTVLVLAALHRLDPRSRAAVVLRHFCGLTIDETAAALDVDEARVLAAESEGLGAFAALLAAARPAGVR
jgi:DNA-directed RNA polymerase specialized sigma24 family protein